MTLLRGAAIGVIGVGALVAGGLPSTAAATAGPTGETRIAASVVSVSVQPRTGLLVVAEDRLFSQSPDEFIQVAPFSAQPGAYVVRVFDEAQEALGRPLLMATSDFQGAGMCLPMDVAVAQLVCTPDVPITLTTAAFQFAEGPVNFAVMDGAPLTVDFSGTLKSDYVQSGSGNDRIYGFDGNDRLFGGSGDDYIDGGLGDDVIEGEAGRDDMRGSSGSNSLDSADGIADIRVDCGGTPAFLDYDDNLDTPTNCGPNPTPIPPGPVEPIDPPAPGEGGGTVDGVPTVVQVTQDPASENRVRVTTGSQGPIFNTGLLWIGAPSGPALPTFPSDLSEVPIWMERFQPNSTTLTSIWSVGGAPGISSRSGVQRVAPLESVEIRVNAQGIAEGTIPIPRGQQPGNYVMQVNGITASGGQMSINVGVVLADETPGPEPVPDESIVIASATRGKGKQAATITVRGATTGLAGTAVSARYRLDRFKGWTTGASVTVEADGTYVLRVKTLKKVRIQVVAGAIRSPGVVVPAAKR